MDSDLSCRVDSRILIEGVVDILCLGLKSTIYVLSLENLKPVFDDQFWREFTVICRIFSADGASFDSSEIHRSSANIRYVTGCGMCECIVFTAKRKRVTLITDPWGTPFSI